MSSHSSSTGSPDDLNARDREHYEVASSMSGWFDKAQFVQRYGIAYPDRNTGSIIPSDYCVNRENKGNAKYPRFLEWDGNSRYRFLGLSSKGVGGGTATQSLVPPPATSPPRPSASRPRHAAARFLPAPGRSFALDAETARAAILAYNRDPKVQDQERRAGEALRRGFVAGQVGGQLVALDRAYSTRSVGSDLVVIGKRIEEGLNRWTTLLSAASSLADRITDGATLGELMAFFLDGPTRRRPRSLATKALHFAAPQCFAPGDTYATDLLGQQLSAGRWSDTDGLDSHGMTTWYLDYLGVIHAIGAANRSLLQTLIALDEESAPGPQNARVRGLPKILDKILWWLGKPDQAESRAQLFR